MSWLAQFDFGKLFIFTLVLARVSGLVMTAPLFGIRSTPPQTRALLCVVIAALVFPLQWNAPLQPAAGPIPYLLLIGGELLIGVCLGLGVHILLTGMRLAGQLIGRISGEMMAELYDPQMDESFAVLSQFMDLVTLAVFVALGGHRILMSGLLDTFQAIPLGLGPGIAPSLVDAFVLLLTQSFTLGIRAAAPLVTALLLSSLVVALVARTLPQLNTMALGFSLNSLVTYAGLMLTLGGAVWIFQDQVEPAVEMLVHALQEGVTL